MFDGISDMVTLGDFRSAMLIGFWVMNIPKCQTLLVAAVSMRMPWAFV
jgi:hypothetical protein